MASRTADEFLAQHPELLDEDERSPALVRRVVELAAPLERYHRFECRGLERVPDGPVLLVANHSAAAVQEILLILRSWYLRFGERPARGLLHRAVYEFPFRQIPLLPRLGGVFAHPRVALRALERGSALLVFPGGELSVCRPFSERHRILLGGRSGFLDLARRARVPIVPLVVHGAHTAYVMLRGAERRAELSGLGRLLGLKAVPMTVGGVVLAATLLLPPLWPLAPLAAAAALVPLPARITAEALDPIPVSAIDAATVDSVQAVMQRGMDRLVAERRRARRAELEQWLGAWGSAKPEARHPWRS
ncbi:MAG: 1-acyl-sn-glycerol-3-phosphate acyltransferase [Myxococcales bacterium]|nr:1-acyl-sn-glycerol-3-phosphate acyltransferase [Myxococcales bacterium]